MRNYKDYYLNRRQTLKVRAKSNKAWETWEEDIIIQYYTKMPMKEFKHYLPHRSVNAIRTRYQTIVRQGRMPRPEKDKAWQDWEIEYIINNYGKLSARELAEKLDVRMTQLYSKTRYLRDFGLIEVKDYKMDGKVNKKEKKAYERLIGEENRDYGMAKDLQKLRFKKGKKYKVTAKNNQGNPVSRTFEGQLIEEFEEFILLEGRYRQCFMKADLLAGEYSIKEVER